MVCTAPSHVTVHSICVPDAVAVTVEPSATTWYGSHDSLEPSLWHSTATVAHDEAIAEPVDPPLPLCMLPTGVPALTVI